MRLPTAVGIGFLALITPSLAAPIDSSLHTRDVCYDPNVSWEVKDQQGCNICADQALPIDLRIKKCFKFTPAVVHENVEGVWRRSVAPEVPTGTSTDEDMSVQDIVIHEPAPGIYSVPSKRSKSSKSDPPKHHDHNDDDDDEPWTHAPTSHVGRRDSDIADLQLSSTPRTTHATPKTLLTSPDPTEHLPSTDVYRRDSDRPGPPGSSGHPGGSNEAWTHEQATSVHTNPGKVERRMRRAVVAVLPDRKGKPTSSTITPPPIEPSVPEILAPVGAVYQDKPVPADG